jgi:hypothetical protein
MSHDIVVMKAVGMAKRKKLSSGIQRRTSDAPYNVDYFARKHDISLTTIDCDAPDSVQA